MLDEKENVFALCVEGSSDAIMITNDKGLLVYVNPAWTSTYGYTKDECIGKSPSILHSGVQDQKFYDEMWLQIRDPAKATWKGELVNKAKDGTFVPVLLSITPHRDSQGNIVGYMGIAVDLGYRKEMESKIAHQDRLASIGLLSSGLAHEIGTPLGVVRGRAEFLNMMTEQPVFKSNLDIIISQTDRISKLIRSLLRVSRNVSEVQLEEFKLVDVINEVLLLLGQNFKEDFVDIQMKVPESVVVNSDYSRVEQVLLNLVMNSIHAIRTSIIEKGRQKGQSILFSIHEVRSQSVVLEVRDTGCGIKPENMKKLFKPFFTTKQVGEGTGLGLAIVAQLVHEIDGKIWANSQIDVGTSFYIELKK